MKKTEFNSAINSVTVKRHGHKVLDSSKCRALPSALRQQITIELVRTRHQILIDLLPDQPDWSWLHSCGYMYKSKSSKTGFSFVHTCEHQIK